MRSLFPRPEEPPEFVERRRLEGRGEAWRQRQYTSLSSDPDNPILADRHPMAGELLLRLTIKLNGNRHTMPHFTGNDQAEQQDRIRLMQDNGRRRMAAMDKLQKHRRRR